MQLELVKSIKASKRQCWNKLLQEVDSDVWGRPYKVAMKRLKSQAIPSPTCSVLLKRIVETFFPQQPSCEIQLICRYDDVIPPVTIEELRKACTKVGNHKCSGLDGIRNIALKAAIEANPDTFLSMYTRCLQEGVFPDKWRQQRLVLLPKGRKPPDEPPSYRPLCMLDTAGKTLERIIHGRIEEVTDRQLSDKQFGFRKSRSTLDAIDLVVKTAKEATSGKRWKGGEEVLSSDRIRHQECLQLCEMESHHGGIGKDVSSRVSAEDGGRLLERQNCEIQHRGRTEGIPSNRWSAARISTWTTLEHNV